jgi:hypothetical protein
MHLTELPAASRNGRISDNVSCIYREETQGVMELDFSESLDAPPDFQPSMLIN